jgi:hypothetical protein
MNPSVSYTLTLTRHHSGEVKKYQQAFMATLLGKAKDNLLALCNVYNHDRTNTVLNAG